MIHSVSLANVQCVIPESPIDTLINHFRFRSNNVSSGEVLLLKKDLDAIDRVGLTLKYTTPSVEITIGNLLITNTNQAIGVHNDPNSLHRVKIACPLFLPQRSNVGTGKDFFASSIATSGWEAVFDEYWSAMGMTLTLDQTNADYPDEILSDVTFVPSKSAFDSMIMVLKMISHGIYFTGSDYKILPWKYENTTNTTLATNSVALLIERKNDESKLDSKMPDTIQVAFRDNDDLYLVESTYSGSLIAGAFTSQITAPNIKTDTNESLLDSLGTDIATLRFDSFIHQDAELNAIYYGSLPFEHSPNANEIFIYHDYQADEIRTLIKSIDPSDEQMGFATFEVVSNDDPVIDDDDVDDDNGSYVCCACDLPKIYVVLENSDTISWKKLINSIVTSGEIVHKIQLTCKADGATTVVTLPAIDCSAIDCQTLDLTGSFVGGCEIGIIYFGNDQSCVPDPNREKCVEFATGSDYSSYTYDGSTIIHDSSPWVNTSNPTLFTTDGTVGSVFFSAVPYQAVSYIEAEVKDSFFEGNIKFNYSGATSSYIGNGAAGFTIDGGEGFSVFVRVSKQNAKISVIFSEGGRAGGIQPRSTIKEIPLDEATHELIVKQINDSLISIKFDGESFLFPIASTVNGTSIYKCGVSLLSYISTNTADWPPAIFDPDPSYFQFQEFNGRWV